MTTGRFRRVNPVSSLPGVQVDPLQLDAMRLRLRAVR